jgi:predicted nuclease with TOPRIM domain
MQDMREEFHALQDENQFLRSKLDSLGETLEYMETRLVQEEFHALQDENQFLRSKLDSLGETLEYMETRLEEQESHKQWIAENLEEAQHFIDNIVGIKGITEDPHGAAVKMGISYAEPSDVEREREPSYRQQQLPRVSISSSIVPSNEELYGY